MLAKVPDRIGRIGIFIYIFCDIDIIGGQMRRKLLSVLDSISMSQTIPEAIQLEFFEPAAIDRLIMSCEQKSTTGHGFCNVKLLHRVLTTELNNVHGASTGTGQRQLMLRVMLYTNTITCTWAFAIKIA